MPATEEDVSDTSDSYELFTLQAGSQSKPLLVTVKANSSDLEMEAIISEAAYNSLWTADSKPPLRKLQIYTKESLQVLGLSGLQRAEKKPPTLNNSWEWTSLKLEWQELHLIHQSHNLQTTLDHHRLLFNSELGEAKGVTAKLHINDNTKPYFCCPSCAEGKSGKGTGAPQATKGD